MTIQINLHIFFTRFTLKLSLCVVVVVVVFFFIFGKAPQNDGAGAVAAARKVFPDWSQKTITHQLFIIISIVLRLGS